MTKPQKTGWDYALHAIWLAIKSGDFISAWKLFIDIRKNAQISDAVFNILDD